MWSDQKDVRVWKKKNDCHIFFGQIFLFTYSTADGNIFCLVAIFVVDDRSSLIYIFLDREIARAARVCGSDCAA